MSESFASIEEFRTADERRRRPDHDLGRWPAGGDQFAEVRFTHGTHEVYAYFTGSGQVELLGRVASWELADALLRLPGSNLTGFAWIRERIESAPTDPGEIQAALAHQKMAWEAFERTNNNA